MSQSLMATYKRLDVTFSKGEGTWLWDKAGKRYLDAISGIAVCSLGHAHPAVTSALCEQASTLVHTSNIYGIENQQQLGDALTSLATMERVFFSNSGAEANEAAIKLARLHGHRNNIKEPAIIVMENSFHGRTLATLTATGNRKVQAGFEPLVQGFIRVPYGDIEAIESLAGKSQNIAAVLVEPVQGEGGINIPDANYLNELRTICDENDWLLMLDEIQTGMGRTGKMFAHQHNGIVPDVMTLAKALGNGMPIGACLVSGKASEILGPGSHGSTFGGNPLACSAAMAVRDVIEQENLIDRADENGKLLRDLLTEGLGGRQGIKEIRQYGMMIGIELDEPCGELVMRAAEAGLLINVTADRVIRLLPPLTCTADDVREISTRLLPVINEFLES